MQVAVSSSCIFRFCLCEQLIVYNKMIGCGSKVSDGDLCLYSLPGLLLETPRTYSNCCQTTSLLIHVEVSRLVLMGERIKKKLGYFTGKRRDY